MFSVLSSFFLPWGFSFFFRVTGFFSSSSTILVAALVVFTGAGLVGADLNDVAFGLAVVALTGGFLTAAFTTFDLAGDFFAAGY